VTTSEDILAQAHIQSCGEWWEVGMMGVVVEPSHPTDIFPTMAIFHHEHSMGLKRNFARLSFAKVMCVINLFCVRFEKF